MLRIKKTVLSDHLRPYLDEKVKVTSMGNITEIMAMEKRNYSGCKIRKINNELYELLDTGEVRNFKHNVNRADDQNSVRQSMQRLRQYLNTNITDVSFCRWVTLTYADNMTDTERLYKDSKEFHRRLRKEVGHYEYITACEPQERGAWHMHMVMIFPSKAPFISKDQIRSAWQQGSIVQVKKLDDVDNVGAYLTAYLADMEYQEDKPVFGEIVEKEIIDDDGNKLKKRYIKGQRLHLYPTQFQLYRISKGIKKPAIEMMTEEKAQKKVNGDTLTFERTISIEDSLSDFKNTINYRYYNSQRKNNTDVISGQD